MHQLAYRGNTIIIGQTKKKNQEKATSYYCFYYICDVSPRRTIFHWNGWVGHIYKRRY